MYVTFSAFFSQKKREINFLHCSETLEDVDSVEDLQSTYLTATMGASQQSLTSDSSTTTTGSTAAAVAEVNPRKAGAPLSASTAGNDERTESEVGKKSLPKHPSTKSRCCNLHLVLLLMDDFVSLPDPGSSPLLQVVSRLSHYLLQMMKHPPIVTWRRY